MSKSIIVSAVPWTPQSRLFGEDGYWIIRRADGTEDVLTGEQFAKETASRPIASMVASNEGDWVGGPDLVAETVADATDSPSDETPSSESAAE
jgi:hypothetical protein